jgi:hypothetical protein
MKKYFYVVMIASLLLVYGSARAALFTVDALIDSSMIGEKPTATPGTGLDTGIYFSAGQMLNVSADPNDLWSAGDLPRWSNANGLTHNLYATGTDETGQPAGALIGEDWGLWTQSGLTAPYGTLVGELGDTFFVIGTNFSGPAPASGTLKLLFWDENSHDNTHTLIDVNVATVPEPGSFILVGVGLMGLAGFARRTTR